MARHGLTRERGRVHIVQPTGERTIMRVYGKRRGGGAARGCYTRPAAPSRAHLGINRCRSDEASNACTNGAELLA